MSNCGCNTTNPGSAFTTGPCGDNTTPPAGFTFNTPTDPCGCGTGGGTPQDLSVFVRKAGPEQNISSILNFTTSPLVPDATENNQAVNYGQLLDAIDFDGILSGLGLTIDDDNTHVLVAPGSWRIDGNVYTSDSIVTLPIDAQDPTLYRYDTVYADDTGTIAVVSGTL